MFGLEDSEIKTALALAKAAYIDARCELCERSLGIVNNSDGMRSHRSAVAGAEFERLLNVGKTQLVTDRKFYILDTRQVVGNCAIWWRPEGKGYTTQLDEAGLYDAKETSRATDVYVPEALARLCAVTHVRIDTLRGEMDKLGIPWPVRAEKRIPVEHRHDHSVCFRSRGADEESEDDH